MEKVSAVKKERYYMRNLLIICVFVLSVNVAGINAYPEEKGLMVRFWDKVSSGWTQDKDDPVVADKKNEGAVERVSARVPEKKELFLSQKALIDEITSRIHEYPALIESLPELSMRKSADGNVDYYYKLTSDIPTRLTKFNKAELSTILDRITREIPLLPTSAPKIQERAEQLPKTAEPGNGTFEALELDIEEEDLDDGVDVSEEELLLEQTSGAGEALPELEVPYTKEEMLDIIYKRLHTFSQIAYMIPDFTMVQDEDGTKEYYFETDEGVLRIEDLDKKILHRLFVRVNNEATILNTQRVMQQIQQQEQLTRTIQQQQQQVQRSIQQQQRPPVTYTPPVVYTPPPLPPQPPKQPPQPPKR